MSSIKISLGALVMSFELFTFNPSNAQSGLPGEGGEPHHICCASNSEGCTDLGGGYWPTNEARVAVTCTI